MVGNHFQGRALGIDISRPGFFDGFFRSPHNVLEQVDVVIGRHILQDAGDTLQAHSRIDVRARQPIHFSACVSVKLRKHEVPDFQVPITVLIGTSRGASLHRRTTVEKDFRARTARSRIAHHPEVIGHVPRTFVVPDAHNAFGRNADFLIPNSVGFVVFLIDRYPEPLGRQLIDSCQKFPRPGNRFAFKVVTEAEIAEHFKEGVVTRRVTDVI